MDGRYEYDANSSSEYWYEYGIQYTSSYLGDSSDIHNLLLAPRNLSNDRASKKILLKDGVIWRLGNWHTPTPLPIQRLSSWRSKVWEVAVSCGYRHKLPPVGSNYADFGEVSWIWQIHHHVQVRLDALSQVIGHLLLSILDQFVSKWWNSSSVTFGWGLDF